MCYLHRQQVTKIRQSQEKAKPPRVPPVFQRLSSAEVKFLNYADVPFFNQDEEFPNPTAAVAAAFLALVAE